MRYLSGGLGKLTDGVIATLPWYEVSNDAGTGEYVGWEIVNPTIDFDFASNVTVGEIKLYVDNSHVGGVTAPSYVVIDGTTYDDPSWQFASAPEIIDITGLNLTGDTVTVTLHIPTQWVFLSGAQFVLRRDSRALDLGDDGARLRRSRRLRGGPRPPSLGCDRHRLIV